MEEARQHSPLGRAKLETAYQVLFWMALVALAATFIGWLIDRQLGYYGFCLWLILLALRAAVTVAHGVQFATVPFGMDRISKSLQPRRFWTAMTFNSLVVMAAIAATVLVLT